MLLLILVSHLFGVARDYEMVVLMVNVTCPTFLLLTVVLLSLQDCWEHLLLMTGLRLLLVIVLLLQSGRDYLYGRSAPGLLLRELVVLEVALRLRVILPQQQLLELLA